LALLQLTKHIWFPTLNLEEADGPYVAQLLTFLENDNVPQFASISNATELRRHLDQIDSTKILQQKVVGRLFILEGLPRDYIKILGSCLRIPASVFGCHSVDPQAQYSLVNREAVYRNSSYFAMNMPKLHHVDIESRPGDEKFPLYRSNMGYSRILSVFGLFGERHAAQVSYEQLSFWCSEREISGLV
jgi:hypothetical protein